MKTGIPCLSLMLLVSCSSFALAAIQVANDASIVGNGSAALDGFNLTRDTATGLEWLDVTLSSNWSFNAVNAARDPGEQFAGFRYATREEVQAFWLHAGVTSDNFFSTEDSIDMDALLNKWGTLSSGNTNNIPFIASDAVTAFTGGGSGHYMASLQSNVGGLTATGAPSGDLALSASVSVPDASASEIRGSALVRNTPQGVPEPSSIAVWGLMASVGLGAAYRRRRASTAWVL